MDGSYIGGQIIPFDYVVALIFESPIYFEESERGSHKYICFLMQEEYSQPFLKPPHLDQPISTLLLSESTMAFGRVLVSDNEGNYRGPLMLSLKEGYTPTTLNSIYIFISYREIELRLIIQDVKETYSNARGISDKIETIFITKFY